MLAKKASRNVSVVTRFSEPGPLAPKTHKNTGSKDPYLAYLVYGSDHRYHLELNYSLLTALRHRGENNFRVCLICDAANDRPDLPVDRIVLSADEIHDWSQAGTYNHRMKPLALARAIDELEAPVALVDTDTAFTDDPFRMLNRIEPGRSVMFERESDLIDAAPWQKLGPELTAGFSIEGIRVAATSSMYNSGVIGLHPVDRALLDKSASLLDGLYARTGIYSVEQLAIGLVLEKETELRTSDDVLRHYWGYGRGFIHLHLETMFPTRDAETFQRMVEAETIADPLNVPTFRTRDRVRARLAAATGMWPRGYRYAYLCYLAARSTDDRRVANVWASVAHHATLMAHEATGQPPPPAVLRTSKEIDEDFS